MRRYEITITFDNGKEVRARVEANNQNDALKRLQASEQFQEFTKDATPTDFDIVPVRLASKDINRYIIKAIGNKQGWCVCYDKETTLRLEWKKGEYNEKQRSKFTVPPSTAEYAAEALRQMADYLLEYFPELV